jgi:hypothetical protein
MPRLKCLSALASIKRQIAIFGLTNRRRRHATNSHLATTFRWQISHIRQREQEEGWLAAEIGTSRRSLRGESWSQSGHRGRREERYVFGKRQGGRVGDHRVRATRGPMAGSGVTRHLGDSLRRIMIRPCNSELRADRLFPAARDIVLADGAVELAYREIDALITRSTVEVPSTIDLGFQNLAAEFVMDNKCGYAALSRGGVVGPPMAAGHDRPRAPKPLVEIKKTLGAGGH